MPKKIDPAVRERVVRRVLERRAEFTSLTAYAAAVAKQERLGPVTKVVGGVMACRLG